MELLEFSKCNPKTFWDTKIRTETFRSVLATKGVTGPEIAPNTGANAP